MSEVEYMERGVASGRKRLSSSGATDKNQESSCMENISFSLFSVDQRRTNPAEEA